MRVAREDREIVSRSPCVRICHPRRNIDEILAEKVRILKEEVQISGLFVILHLPLCTITNYWFSRSVWCIMLFIGVFFFSFFFLREL